MRNIPFILKSLFLALILFGTAAESISQNRYSLYFEAGPNYINRRFDSPHLIITNEIVPRITLSTALKVGYQVSENFQIISGLQYINRGYYTVVDPSLIKQNFFYLELPILVKYEFILGKVKLAPIVGVTNGLLSAFSYSDDTFGYSDFAFLWDLGFKKYELSFHGGVELSYWMRNTAIKIEPKFCHSIIPRNESDLVNEYFYSIGINLGIIHKIQTKDK